MIEADEVHVRDSDSAQVVFWERLRHRVLGAVALVGILGVVAWFVRSGNDWRPSAVQDGEIPAAWEEARLHGGLTLDYPFDGAVFPPEIAPPTFSWSSETESDAWIVAIDFSDGGPRLSRSCSESEWRPSDEDWASIKARSIEAPAKVSVFGFSRGDPGKLLAAGKISMSTSQDEVGAPLFFREVNLPFADAVRDPARCIRWRFGPISSKVPPPVVLEKMPVCANCHSFSADGSVLGMDVDYANDKGSYVITSVEEEIEFESSKIITWSDYRREDSTGTFGLLSQISPDGKYAICTVKDRSVFVAVPDLEFSQIFFPIEGILCCYDRERREFRALSGADDPEYVQSNPSWSPDGRDIVFARAKVRRIESEAVFRSSETTGVALLNHPECVQFLKEVGTFQYDLYRVPFNGGKGGKAEPIEGASGNGKSNYFARYSPDGKWIVFCQSKSFMLLQPDSELYIIPAEGGQARRLACNTNRMNSWHSWSPNGRWLVFSSKARSLYTQLFLTHIDEAGNSSPPVALSSLTEEGRAANIPEFVNVAPDAISEIAVSFLNDTHFVRSAADFRQQLDYENAIRACRKALEINPDNADAHSALGFDLNRLGESREAEKHFRRALELDGDDWRSHEALGVMLAERGDLEEATVHFREVVRITPKSSEGCFRLGVALMDGGRLDEAKTQLAEAVRLNPLDAKAAFCLGGLHLRCGEGAEAVSCYRRTLEIDPDAKMAMLALASVLATSEDPALRNGEEAVKLARRACKMSDFRDPQSLHVMAVSYAEAGRMSDAVAFAKNALEAAKAAGNDGLADTIERSLLLFEQGKPLRCG
ncbi:MAG: tetratricopeptide repeat protein [Planctomycetaceae bacterium]|nr:tetratricopeptide repeat protein [Planctomycetaceae bacterium]